MITAQVTAHPSEPSAVAAPPILSVQGLSVEFPGPNAAIRAVGDVSFSIPAGDILALVGESGSGKSVTALSILGLVSAPGRLVGGSVQFEGRELTDLPEHEMARIRGRRIGWVSQTPRASLNPSFKIGRQIAAVLAACSPDLKGSAVDRRIDALLRPLGFTEPARVTSAYPHQLSGGMCQRVCIALALAGDPIMLIADEPTTALDVSVQAQILSLLHQLNAERGLSILIITHDLAIVSALSHRVMVLYGGQVQETGPTAEVLADPAHPYTRALIAAIPDSTTFDGRIPQLRGQAEPPIAGVPGCRFAARCDHAFVACHQTLPSAHAAGHGGRVRCHLHQPVGSP